MHTDNVIYRTHGFIGEITLNRPDKLNSITAEMVQALHVALDKAQADDAVRVVVLRGNGRAFSSGFDLSEMETNPTRASMQAVLEADFDIIMRFWNCPKPTLSAVQGYVLGGGFELAMACDVTIAAQDALFGEPEPKFGSGIVALLLPWLTGPKQAKEMLLFGDDRITAQRAYDMGLINAVVDANALAATCESMAKRCAMLDATAVRLTKQAIHQSYGAMGFEKALRQALEIDLEIETTDTEESRTFKSILAESGVKAAIAWREARFAQSSATSNTAAGSTHAA
jgi:enoyl-CoA hydratase